MALKMLDKKKRINSLIEDIKRVKIQGAENIAKKALKFYLESKDKRVKNLLLSIRPTEPLLRNVLEMADKEKPEKILNHFKEAQNKINEYAFKIIRNNDIIFTYCHSNTVAQALIYSRKKGKKFKVYNTETRPLFQGRKTANQLRKNKINVTMFVDSAIGVALAGEQGNKKPDKIFLGADALLKKGIINKIGSETICILAKINKIPVYILADSWKFSLKKVKLEKRGWREVWKSPIKRINLKIENPAFEFVPEKYISGGIITEHGIMKYRAFVKFIKKYDRIKP